MNRYVPLGAAALGLIVLIATISFFRIDRGESHRTLGPFESETSRDQERNERELAAAPGEAAETREPEESSAESITSSGAIEGAPRSPKSIMGRCVANSVPIGGATVRITALDGALVRTQQYTGVSNIDGRFTIDVPSQSDTQYVLHCAAPGYTSRQASLGPPAADPIVDLGDIEMPPATVLYGVVTSQVGAPVAHAYVNAQALEEFPSDLEFGALGSISARTDEIGRYEFGAIPASRWSLTVSKPGVAQQAPVIVHPQISEPLRTDIVVREAAPISGNVIRKDGTPLAGAVLYAFDSESGEQVSWATVASSTGEFTVALAPGAKLNEIVMIALEQSRAYQSEPLRCRWGDTGVQVVAVQNTEVAVRVVPKDSQHSLNAFSYRLATNREIGGVVRPATVIDGIARISLGEPIEPWITVIPGGPYAVTGPIDLSTQLEAVTPITIEVDAARIVQIEVVDSSATPAVGIEARVMSVAADATLNDIASLTVGDAPSIMWSGTQGWLWGSTTTDSHGRATLPVPDIRNTRAYIWLQSDARGEMVVPLGAAEEQRVEIARTGTSVTLRLGGQWPIGARIQLQPTDSIESGPLPLGMGILASNASSVTFPVMRADSRNVVLRYLDTEIDIGHFNITDGDIVTWSISCDEVLWPQKEFIVTLDGARLENGLLNFELRRSDGREVPMTQLAVESGRVVLPPLPKGVYAVRLEGVGAYTEFSEAQWGSPSIDLR